MILNNYFDNIYVPYIYDKELVNIKWKFDELNLKVQYFKGYNGLLFENYDDFLHNQICLKKKDTSIVLLTRGQYGHITTFINILNDAIKNKYKKILVLEPDVYLSNNIQDIYKKYTDIDYKILYLGASQNCYYTEKTWDKINIIKDYYNAYKTLGTFAIAFDNSVFNEIIQILSQYKYPTDVALFELQNKYNNVYVCYPNIICCNVINSTTNGVRSKKTIQTERMINCKWILDYDTREKIVINLNKKIIKLTLYINSKLNNSKIDSNCSHYIDYINEFIYIISLIPDINIKPVVILYNIFIDKYEIS